MSSRKLGYLIGLALLALVFSAPQWMTCLYWARDHYLGLSFPSPAISETWDVAVELDRMIFDSADWHGQYIDLAMSEWGQSIHTWRLTAFDLRTRQTHVLNENIAGNLDLHPVMCGDRIWLASTNETYEFVDGVVRPTNFALPISWGSVTDRFLWDGNPALLQRTDGVVRVQTFKDGAWNITHELILPQPVPVFAGSDQEIPRFPEVVRCITHAGRIHLFLCVDGFLMYRQGLELRPLTDEPASALSTANQDPAVTPWVRVCAVPEPSDGIRHFQFFGMLQDDRPIAMVVRHGMDAYSTGTFFRYDGTRWTQYAVQQFPFAAGWIHAVNGQDGKSAVVVARTAIRSYVYDVDDAGIRLIPWKHPQGITAIHLSVMLMNYGTIVIVTTLSGILLGFGVWLMMQRYTRADYGFGTQHATLASLQQRGVARLLDVSLVAVSTIGIGAILMRDMDWILFVEAVDSGVPHPMKQLVIRAVWGLLFWFVTLGLTLLFMQGRWGLTPGKWCCGLRTVRSTLRPCGFARSLVREVVLWVDACGFLCWTPGVLSIALTDCRQRLGDVIADTIVVNALSMKPHV